MFANVDLTEPMNAVIFTTGLLCWAAGAVSFLWAVVASVVYYFRERRDSKDTVFDLFGEIQ